MEQIERTAWDRIGISAVVLLLAAFVLSMVGPLVSSVGAEDRVAGNRDDKAVEVVAVEDDDDDDGRDRSGGGSNSSGGNSGAADNSKNSKSANTRTGTTRGTGPSNSVSNSSSRSANTG